MEEERKAQASTASSLSDAELEELQSVLDAHCEKLMSDYKKGWSEALDSFMKSVTTFKALEEYPAVGSAPHERVFLSHIDQLIVRLRDEMRLLRGIYETLGLRTNYPLYRVLGYTSQGRKHEPQVG